MLAKQITKNCGAVGCNTLNNCGETAGQSVDHLHFHIIPRYSDQDAVSIKFMPSKKQDLDEVLAKIKG
jgi:histidine triad (HIT) family protein